MTVPQLLLENVYLILNFKHLISILSILHMCIQFFNLFAELLSVDSLVKNLRLRHSHAGGNPEAVEITRSKSPLISSLHGNDETFAKYSFYDTIISL